MSTLVVEVCEVITPVIERDAPELGGGGRVILKSISAEYLARKGGTDDH